MTAPDSPYLPRQAQAFSLVNLKLVELDAVNDITDYLTIPEPWSVGRYLGSGSYLSCILQVYVDIWWNNYGLYRLQKRVMLGVTHLHSRSYRLR
jgi:hypothetical protein